MKIAYLAVGDRTFTLPPEAVEEVMGAAAAARAGGEWLEFRDAGGRLLRMLIPDQTLLVIQEHEVSDDAPAETDPNDWAMLDYDL